MTKALVAIFLLSSPVLYAQVTSDTLFLNSSITNSIKLYNQTIKGQTALYNGTEYKEPSQTNDEHPFFESEDWVFGNVTYEGKYYEHVPLLYDIVTDRLVTENYYNAEEVSLVIEKINKFTFGDHIFIKENHKSLPKSGFYELLYDGVSKAIARRQKVTREAISSQKLEIHFDTRNRFYVFKNNIFFPVKGKNSLLKLFEDEKQTLRQFIKKNNVRFKPDPAKGIAQLAAQYDKLKISK